jgi:hypothetical protein
MGVIGLTMNTKQFHESVMKSKSNTELEDVFNTFYKSAIKSTPGKSKEELYEEFYAKNYFEPLTKWWKDTVNIKTLLHLENFMNITSWIKKLACKKHNFDESGLCPFCPKNTPTLDEIVTNMHKNVDSSHYKTIINIQNLFQKETLSKDDAFIILVDFDDKPYMYDGNHRLIAFADKLNENNEITVFFGVK